MADGGRRIDVLLSYRDIPTLMRLLYHRHVEVTQYRPRTVHIQRYVLQVWARHVHVHVRTNSSITDHCRPFMTIVTGSLRSLSSPLIDDHSEHLNLGWLTDIFPQHRHLPTL
jgi:hypothetical protein